MIKLIIIKIVLQKKNNLDNYSSGPILKLLIEKSQNKIEEKSEDEN